MLQTSLRQRSSAIVTSLAPFHGRPIASISLQISAPCKQRCPIRHFSAFKVRQKVRDYGAQCMKNSRGPQSKQLSLHHHCNLQPVFSSRASLSASPALTVEVATRKPDPHPRSLLRLAVLLGVGFLAVSLLSPAAAWAKGAAASTPSYSFPAAARGAVLATISFASNTYLSEWSRAPGFLSESWYTEWCSCQHTQPLHCYKRWESHPSIVLSAVL